MKFYVIIHSHENLHNPKSYQFLEQACRQRDLEFVAMESQKVDYRNADSLVETGSLLYRIAIDRTSRVLEEILWPKVISFSTKLIRPKGVEADIVFRQADLPIIPSIFNINKDSKLLDKYVESLGGFPVIIKVLGRSHGQGVFMANNLSQVDKILSGFGPSDDVVMKKFIVDAEHIRLVVIGDKVASTVKYLPQAGDFRTNAVETPQVELIKVSDEMKQIAIRVTQANGCEFGGVDILREKNGNYHIAELNSPCNFARNQMNTNEDIAGQMVDYLIDKAKRELPKLRRLY